LSHRFRERTASNQRGGAGGADGRHEDLTPGGEELRQGHDVRGLNSLVEKEPWKTDQRQAEEVGEFLVLVLLLFLRAQPSPVLLRGNGLI